MFKNLSQKHLIEVMGSFGILGEMWKSGVSMEEMDSDDVFEQTLSFGRQVGNIVARAIDIWSVTLNNTKWLNEMHYTKFNE